MVVYYWTLFCRLDCAISPTSKVDLVGDDRVFALKSSFVSRKRRSGFGFYGSPLMIDVLRVVYVVVSAV